MDLRRESTRLEKGCLALLKIYCNSEQRNLSGEGGGCERTRRNPRPCGAVHGLFIHVMLWEKQTSGYSYGTRTPKCICYSYGIKSSSLNLYDISKCLEISGR